MQIKSYSKADLAKHYGVSSDQICIWLKQIEHLLPYYKRTAKVLTPAQVTIIFRELGEI